MKIQTSYVICAVQRSGSFLLCEVLKNTGLAGVPEEYFLYHPGEANWEKSDWARQHNATSRHSFVQLVQRHATTPNGILGLKLMWNYFPQVVSALQSLPGRHDLPPHPLLQSLFPNLHYIWMVRRDKVRQAVSWAIAAQTGIYAAWQAESQLPLQEPVFDFAQIDLLYNLILEGEAGWANFFKSNHISPMKVIYEELVDAYEAIGLQILDFLGVSYPANFVYGQERKMKKQATDLNEVWAQKYQEIKQSVTKTVL